MKTILVPTDFSDAANNAAKYAVDFAKETNANVLLFHSYHVPMPNTEVPVIIVTPDELQKENEVRLKKEADSLMEKTGVEVNYLAKMGLAVDEILNEEENASLIVMGMKGASKLSEALMGSITTATIREAKTPVLVIPEGAKYKNPDKIVFACDYNPKTDTKAIDSLKEFVRPFRSKIYVLNIKSKQESASIEEAVVGIDLENKLSGIEHIYYFPEKDDLVEGINDFVKEHNADMVVIIPHRYNLREGLFHTSVSKKMAFHTQVPMLALHDNGK